MVLTQRTQVEEWLCHWALCPENVEDISDLGEQEFILKLLPMCQFPLPAWERRVFIGEVKHVLAIAVQVEWNSRSSL